MGFLRAFSLLLAGLALVAPAAAQPHPQGGEFQVNSHTSGDQQYPAVAADASGNFVVAWKSQNFDGSGTSIQVQRFAVDGTPLGVEFQANSFTMWDQFVPAVAVAPGGDFVVVWGSQGEQDGSQYSVHAQRYAADGSPQGGEFQVNTYTMGRQSYPAVAMDTVGNFVVAWHSEYQDGSGQSVHGQRFAADATPLGGEFQINSYTTEDQRTPAIAMRSDGEFIVVWKSQDQTPAGGITVHGQRYAADGGALGGEFQVCQHTFNGIYAADLAFDSAGNFSVVWDGNRDSDGVSVQVRRFDAAGNPLGDEYQLNTYETGYQGDPRMVSAADGTLAVVWGDTHQESGSGSGVFGRLLTASGDPMGTEFHANTHTPDWQDRPDIASASTHDFVVVWQSRDQDGSGASVHGQRYRGLIGLEIFEDGFESGDTSAWSATFP